MTVAIKPMHSIFLPILLLGGSACPSGAAVVDLTGDSSNSSSTTEEPVTPTTGEDLPDPTTTTEEGTTSTSDASSSSSGTTESMELSSSSDVEPQCGDGHVDPGEVCDDGFANNTNTSACLPDCKLARCGDGLVQDGLEDCDLGDTGNSHEYGGCNPVTCKWGPRCGDGQVDAPNEVCDPGDPESQNDGVAGCDETCRFVGRIVFLTSKKYDGDLGGLAGADKLCRDLASTFDAARAASYRAWLSDATESPQARFGHGPEFDDVPYVLRSGVQIAANFTALATDGPWPGIDLTDDDQVLTLERVWTNTGVDGHALSDLDHCNGWTSTAGVARFGFNWLPAMSPDLAKWLEFGQWTNGDTISCQKQFRLYCFEN